MHDNDEQAKLRYRGGVTVRPKNFLTKTLSVVLGSVVLVSAFVFSIAFFAIGLAVLLAFGGYLWWKTRHLRRQLRDQFEAGSAMEQTRADVHGDVIEGVVLSRKETSDQSRR